MAIANKGNQGDIRMWPSEDWASRLYDLANSGLIVGLVLGVISTILVVWMGNVKETYLRKELGATSERAALIEKGNLVLSGNVAGLQTDASNAKAAQQEVETELAKQRERAANAERALLELQEHNKPRRLTADQKRLVLEKIADFKGTPYDLYVNPNPEPVDLMNAVDVMLVSSGWVRSKPWNSTELIGDKAEAYILEGGLIQASDEKLIPAGQALTVALRSVGIDIVFSNRAETPGMTVNPHTIHIAIGSK